MSRDDLVHKLARAGSRNDQEGLRETMSALIAEAHAQQKHGQASRLRALIEARASTEAAKMQSLLPESLLPLIREEAARRPVRELVFSKAIVEEVREFVDEYGQAALLRSHSLEPRHTVLLVGPPGTGKTSLASALAYELGLPFLTVRYDGLVGSYLGETAGRLQQIVDYVGRIPCVLFFDEFESVGKERGDAQETGEIKRVVSSLLMHMDSIPSSCVIVCATNHPEMLDRAVWRRFELRMELPLPSAAELRDWLIRTEKSLGPLGITAKHFTDLLAGQSFSEIEAITLDARRKIVLSGKTMKAADAFKRAIEAWQRRRLVGESGQHGGEANCEDRARAGKRKARSKQQEIHSAEADLLSRAAGDPISEI